MASKAKKVIEKSINDLEKKAIPYLDVKSALLVEAAIMHLVEALEFENDTENHQKPEASIH